MKDEEKTKGQLLEELAEMRQWLVDLEASEAQRQRAEEALREGLKELTCLYQVSRDMQEALSTDALCRRVIEHLVPAMQFPEITVPVIELDGRRFTSERYTEGLSHGLHAEIRVEGEARGHLWVYYAEDRPFLIPEEQNLVNGVAEIISLWLERKRAEEMLDQAHARLQYVIASSPAIIYSCKVDPEGKPEDGYPPTFVSGSIARRFGYEVQECLNDPKWWTEHLHPEDAPRAIAEMTRLFKQGHVIHEYRIRHKDGSYRWVRDELVLVRDAVGKPVEFVGSWMDITERKRAEEELIRLSSAVKMSADSIVIADLEGNIVDVNEAALKMYGTDDKGDLIGQYFLELIAPEQRKEALAAVQAVLERGYDSSRGYEVIVKDGSRVPVELSAAVMKDADGEPTGFVGIARDITERQRAEEALAQERNLLRALMDNVPDYIYFKDRESRFIRTTKAHAKTFGLSDPAEAIGKTDFDFFSDEHAHQAYEDEQEIIRTGQPLLNMEERETWPDRPDTWALTSKMPLRDEEGKIVGTFGISRDITERRRAEEEYRTILRTAMDGFWLANVQGRFLDVNDAYCRLIGYSHDELLTMGIQDVEALERPEDVARRIQRVMETGSDRFETRHRCKDGRVVDVEVSVNYMKDEERLFVFLRDITERKRAEEELHRRAKELAALQATVLDITARHDLPTLLQTIVERAALLLNAPGGELYLCDPDRREVRCVVSYNTLHDYTGTVLKYGEGAAGTVAQTRQPLIIDDYRVWNRRAAVYEEEQPFTAVLSAPMIWQGQVTGVIHVLHDVESRRFTEADLELLTLFANHAAIAVENARLYEEAQQEITERKRAEEALELRAEQLAALNQASQVVTASLELDQVLSEIVSLASRLTTSDYTSVALMDEAGHMSQSTENLPGVPAMEYRIRDEGFTSWIVRSRQAVVIDEIGESGAVSPDPGEGAPLTANPYLVEAGVKSFVGLPLVAKDRLLGVLYLHSLRPHVFQGQLPVLTTFANHAAIAIENAGLYQETQRELAERKRAEEALQQSERELSIRNRIAEIFLTTPNDEMYEEMLQVVLEVTESKYGIFGYINEDGALVCPSMTREVWDRCQIPDKDIVFPRQTWGGLWGYALIDKKTLYSNKPLRVPNGHIPILRALDVPIIHRREVIGNLLVGNKATDYNREDCTLLEAIANYIAPILHARLQEDREGRERKQAEEEVRRHLERVEALREIDRAITSTLDLPRVLDIILEGLERVIPYHSAGIFLFSDGTARLTAGRGFPDLERVLQVSFPVQEDALTREVLQEKRPLVLADAQADERFLARGDTGYVRSWIGVPLIARGKVVGFLTVDHREPGVYGEQSAEMAQTFASQAAIAIENARLYEEARKELAERKQAQEELRQSYVNLQRALEGTVHVLVSAIEMRDPYTAGHQRRVTQLACAIANEMGLPDERIEGIRMAGLIHDIGKISVPAEILSRPSQLTDLEFGLIKMHPQTGYDVLKATEFPWPVAQIVLQHHERMDGSGYPQELSGEEILLEARILGVADVVEAMASHRPYRSAQGIDKALEEISQNRGTLYDPEVVDACLKLFIEKGFKLE